jgi:hypothetical protein
METIVDARRSSRSGRVSRGNNTGTRRINSSKRDGKAGVMAYSQAETHLEVEGVQPVQVLTALAAATFVLIGGIGLLRTGTNLFDETHTTILGLTLNPLRSWIYLGVGSLGLVEALTSTTARAFCWFLCAGCGLLFVWGLVPGDPLGLTITDAWWHLGASVTGLLIAIHPARKAIYLGATRIKQAHHRHETPRSTTRAHTKHTTLELPEPHTL